MTFDSMANAHDGSSAQAPPPGQFATTQWSLVVAAAGTEAEAARRALESLCSLYWPPLYAYVRRQGFLAHQAEDLTQEFFAMLLDRGDLARARLERGRFRAFLLTALRHFLLNERERERALKRGGGRRRLSFDFPNAEGLYSRDVEAGAEPEAVFERQWALLLLVRARQRLGDEYAKAGKQVLFSRLEGMLAGDRLEGGYAEAGFDLGMTEGAVKVAMHRLRQRFGMHLRDEIAQTVASPAEVDEEIQDLFEALRQ